MSFDPLNVDVAKVQNRFTQLAQRSFKTRISVLLLLFVALFILWSTLARGTQKAEQVDRDFCEQLIKDPYYSTGSYYDEFSCNPVMLETTLEQARHKHDNDAPYPDSMTTQEKTKHIEEFLHSFQQFHDYEWNRSQAYRVNLALPYSENAASLNGLLISETWPFCALLVLSMAIALRFRQTCYEIHLSACIANGRPKSARAARATDIALSEFMSGDISQVEPGVRQFISIRDGLSLPLRRSRIPRCLRLCVF